VTLIGTHRRYVGRRRYVRPTKAVQVDPARYLLAGMSRALRDAGWSAGGRIPASWRHCRSHQYGLITWEQGTVRWTVTIHRTISGYAEVTVASVTSAQQAIDLVAALTGVGTELTTGARVGAR
jgi:hypothetical protein